MQRRDVGKILPKVVGPGNRRVPFTGNDDFLGTTTLTAALTVRTKSCQNRVLSYYAIKGICDACHRSSAGVCCHDDVTRISDSILNSVVFPPLVPDVKIGVRQLNGGIDGGGACGGHQGRERLPGLIEIQRIIRRSGGGSGSGGGCGGRSLEHDLQP